MSPFDFQKLTPQITPKWLQKYRKIIKSVLDFPILKFPYYTLFYILNISMLRFL